MTEETVSRLHVAITASKRLLRSKECVIVMPSTLHTHFFGWLVLSFLLSGAGKCDGFILPRSSRQHICSNVVSKSDDDTLAKFNNKHFNDAPKILLIGATGRLGSIVAQKLRERSIPYQCLVRPKSLHKLSKNKTIDYDNDKVKIIEGDLANQEDVERAVSGTSSCICVSGTFRKTKFRDLLGRVIRPQRRSCDHKDSSHPYNVHYVGTQNLCRAMKNSSQGTNGKLVKVTGVMLSLPSSHPLLVLGNLIYSGLPRWHKAGEKVIVNGDIDYTILRPGSFREEAEYRDSNKRFVIDEEGALPRLYRGGKKQKPLVGIEALADLCIDCCLGKEADASSNRKRITIDTIGKILYPRWEF